MYKYNEKLLNGIINFLQELQGQNVTFNIIPPHIEEVFGTVGGEIYGKMVMDIHIDFEDLYKLVNEITGRWKK